VFKTHQQAPFGCFEYRSGAGVLMIYQTVSRTRVETPRKSEPNDEQDTASLDTFTHVGPVTMLVPPNPPQEQYEGLTTGPQDINRYTNPPRNPPCATANNGSQDFKHPAYL
jgi:hypothetical protein